MHTVSLRKVAILGLACLVLVSLTLLASQSSNTSDAKKMKNPVASNAQSIEAGKLIYTKSCAPCHGATGKGDGAAAAQMTVKPSNLADEKWDHGSTDGEIFVLIRDGLPKSAMKGFKEKVKDPEVWNIVNYLRSIGPKKTTN